MTRSSSTQRRVGIGLVSVSVVVMVALKWAVVDRPSPPGRQGSSGRPIVTAAVERRALDLTVVASGSIVAVDQVSVRAPVRAEGQVASVVSATPLAPGSEVGSGTAVVEINGRPVIVLALAVAMFRDLTPGSVGPDVTALQDELRRLGLGAAGEDGVFGPATQAAVAALFEHAGYEPAYAAGSRAAFDAGLAEARGAERAALDAANAARRSGDADPALDAAWRAAQQAVSTWADTQGVALRTVEVARIPHEPMVGIGQVPAVGDGFDVGQVVIEMASPRPAVHLQVSAARASEITSTSTVDLVGAGFSTTCAVGSLLPAARDAPAEGDRGPGDSAGASGGGSVGDPGLDDRDSGPSTKGVDVTFALRCTRSPRLDQVGSDVTATVRTRVAAERLVVPATAVVSRPDGRTFVHVVGPGGRLRRVQVDAVAEAGGFVSIEVRSGRLGTGDRLRVTRG